MSKLETLVAYQKTIKNIQKNWPNFLKKRAERLASLQEGRDVVERVAENIIEDLFTNVLDWKLSDLNNQMGKADFVLTHNGLKRLIIETKRPAKLIGNQKAIEQAIEQARRYAGEQNVSKIAISDGHMLYAADIINGGLQGRAFVTLDTAKAPEILWWLSVHGIYRDHDADDHLGARELPHTGGCALPTADAILHPKYKIPATCFAYVGNAAKTSTWSLPYKQADGSIDPKRLPKAIQVILTNYRGQKLGKIPEHAIPDVLVRLAIAAQNQGRMPYQSCSTADVYKELESALIQFNRLDEVKK